MNQSELIFRGEWPSKDPMFGVGLLRDSLFSTVASIVQPNDNGSAPIQYTGIPEVKGVTASGGASVTQSVKKFGASSLWLIASRLQILRVLPYSDFVFTVADMNIECWVQPTTLGTNNRTICASGSSPSQQGTYRLYIGPDKLPRFTVNGTGGFTITSNTEIQTGSFSFVSISRRGNIFRLMLNGKIVGTYTSSSNLSLQAMQFIIGAGGEYRQDKDEFADYFDGYIDAFRVVSGNAVYWQETTPGTVGDAVGFTVSGTQIRDATGKNIRFTGLNWGGAEHEDLVPVGLWARSYTDHLNHMKQLGFNCIRWPICDDMIVSTKTTYTSINYSLGTNRELQGMTPLQIMKRMMDYCKQIGMFVIIDHHRTFAGTAADDGTMDHGRWYDNRYSENDVIANWQRLAQMFADNEYVVGADLHNEPHGNGVTWGRGGDDWRAAAIRIANAIHQVNPNWLVFAEGVEWSGTYAGDSTNYDWWGGNLRDARDVSRRFIINRMDKAVYSAHTYGQSVATPGWLTGAGETINGTFYPYPRNVAIHWDESWGWLYRQKVAPLFIGETGGQFTNSAEVQLYDQLISYMNGDFNLNGTTILTQGEQGIHYTMWGWSPLSVDTGGLVDNATWSVVDQNKMRVWNRALYRETITPKVIGGVTSTGVNALPTSAPGNVPGTVLLLNFDDGLTDTIATIRGAPLNKIGNPTVIPYLHRTGGAALKISKANYFQIPSSPRFEVTNKNWVIEALVMFTKAGVQHVAACTNADRSNAMFDLYKNATEQLCFAYNSTATGWTTITGVAPLVLGRLYKLTIARSGTAINTFIDVDRDQTAGIASGTYMAASTMPINLGHSDADSAGNEDLEGLMLGFRFSIGTDRGNGGTVTTYFDSFPVRG